MFTGRSLVSNFRPPIVTILTFGNFGCDNGGKSAPGDSEIWKWPPASKPSADNRQSAANSRWTGNQFYDVVFTVER